MKPLVRRRLKQAGLLLLVVIISIVSIPLIQLRLDESFAKRLSTHIKENQLDRDSTVKYLKSELPRDLVVQSSGDLSSIHVELPGRTVFSGFAVGTSWWYIDIEFDKQGKYKHSYKAVAAVYL